MLAENCRSTWLVPSAAVSSGVVTGEGGACWGEAGRPGYAGGGGWRGDWGTRGPPAAAGMASQCYCIFFNGQDILA